MIVRGGQVQPMLRDIHFVAAGVEADLSVQRARVVLPVVRFRHRETIVNIADRLADNRLNVLLQQHHGRFSVKPLDISRLLLVKQGYRESLNRRAGADVDVGRMQPRETFQ